MDVNNEITEDDGDESTMDSMLKSLCDDLDCTIENVENSIVKIDAGVGVKHATDGIEWREEEY